MTLKSELTSHRGFLIFGFASVFDPTRLLPMVMGFDVCMIIISLSVNIFVYIMTLDIIMSS